MRPPRLDFITAKRGFEKLRGWFHSDKRSDGDNFQLPNNLDVSDMKMWPWMKRPWDRWINKQLLSSQLQEKSNDFVAITTIPIVSDLVEKLPVKRWIYYCVDDFSSWPGLDGKTLLQHENRLIEKVDKIVCVSDTLMESVKKRGRESVLLTHGVDAEFWQTESKTHNQFGLNPNESVALFWGVIDRRMNADWLIHLSDQLTDGSIILAGPQQDPDPRILNHPRIKTLGPIPFEELPALAKLANALIMPYADLPVTRAMQPLKLKEYLATLRPVVASSLPAVKPWQNCLDMVETMDQFVAATLGYMRAGKGLSPKENITRQALRTETWAAKAVQLERVLEG